MNDDRIEFLVNSIASVCSVSDKNKLSEAIIGSKDVQDFLDDTKWVYFHYPVFTKSKLVTELIARMALLFH